MIARTGTNMTETILSRKEGAIGHLVFNNPDKLNAISLSMWEGMGAAVEAFERDDDIRVIVLYGAGGKAFVAGADVSKYEEERMGDNAQEHYAQTGERALSALYNSTKATIAAIDGYCIGGGISVAVSCDLRIATTKSQFAQPAMRYGIGYRYKSLRRVADLIGPAAAKDLLIGGYMFDAQEAYVKGLVGRVLPEEGFMDAIIAQAKKIAEGAPLTLRQVKHAIAQIVKDPGERDLDEAERLFQHCYASRDYREGIRAFAEKRKPQFVGS
jgi:enoyl-CoA hydratase/carnithine racemase